MRHSAQVRERFSSRSHRPLTYAAPVRTRRLGSSDLEVSVVGLGCNNFGGRTDEVASRAVIDAALDAGVTFFDTADVYGNRGGSEEIIGRALVGRRERVVLATKFGHDLGDGETARGARPYIRKAVAASLRRLQTDWIDLYQYHRPDGVTPLEETLAALDELVQEGTVRAIGSSNFTAEMVEESHAAAEARGLTSFASEQSEYSWLKRGAEEELLPACARLGIGFVPYFPLASGLLTGKYRRGEPAPEGTRLHGREVEGERFDKIERLERLAGERGRTLLELAIGGLAAVPGVVSVIAGATRPEQVRANAAAGAWEATAEDVAAIRALA
jgi:aryl-alcohol dehydrogenase-like predicted oxidoreductase